jgi:predicted peroxiredoxin/TusA-related sulfurtransferase
MGEIVDVRGRSITTYIACRAAEALDVVPEGGTVEIVTDRDPAVDHDLRAWCRATDRPLLPVDGHADHAARYVVEKRSAAHPARRPPYLAMVISDAGLEELLSPLGFALAAALEGAQVSLYFQGPAVRVLTAGFAPQLRGWKRPFSRFARRGLERAGHVAPQEKVAELRRFGARLYACGPSMRHFHVRTADLLYDDVTVAEYLTFWDVLAHADVPVYV